VTLAALCLLAVAVQDAPARQNPPLELAPEEAGRSVERAAQYLVDNQNEKGSWGSGAPESVLELGFARESYYAWPIASQGLACMALASLPDTPERRRTLERAVRYLCTTRLPARGDDWDVDHVWSALYGFVATVELVADERFAAPEWQTLVRERGRAFYDILVRYQADTGGWAYYDDPPFIRTPTWATSFCTALVLPALLQAKASGFIDVEQRIIDRATRYVQACALPGGAYSYDRTAVTRLGGVEHINLIQGSLGRTQVCNWALRRAGDRKVTDDVLREGLEAFFDYHAFLDHVRTRPIPHEGFYANAGYFYFFAHYYAAKVIAELPAEERESWHRRLRPHLTKTQWERGATSDFLKTTYMITASTSYLILSLSEGLRVD